MDPLSHYFIKDIVYIIIEYDSTFYDIKENLLRELNMIFDKTHIYQLQTHQNHVLSTMDGLNRLRLLYPFYHDGLYRQYRIIT